MQVTVKSDAGLTFGDYEFPEVPAVGDTVTIPDGSAAGLPVRVLRRVFHGSTQRDAPIRPIVIVGPES